MNDIHKIELPDSRKVFDADLSVNGNWIAIVGGDTADTALYAGTEVRLHRQFRFPNVRIIDQQRFLVVDSHAKTPSDTNASLVSVDSPWRPINFHAGDGIQDVLVTTNHIVCTYFDEGIFSNNPFSIEGVSAFDFSGRFCFGYRSRLKTAAVEIDDCYAACNVNGDEIAFCAYTGFPRVNWNLRTGTHAVVPLPGELHGASAMTSCRGIYFFYSPYKSRHAISEYNEGNYRQIATVEGRLKTLRDGKFLRIEPDEFSIIDCCAAS